MRAAFPALELEVHGHPLAYLDNASTTQKPRAVLDAVQRAYVSQCANVHRGVHHLSEVATDAFEGTRDLVRGFVGAAEREEIVFTRGATEAINLVAQSYGRSHVRAGDQVLVSEMEHHSNLVPWQLLCNEVGAELRMLPMDAHGELVLGGGFDQRTRIVAVTHASNSLGTINDVETIVGMAHDVGAVVVVDGAQAAAHIPIDVAALGCDFYAFSGHKMYGPTGTGVLYGKRELLEVMPPWQGGGDMILTVSFEGTAFNRPPHKFEAGTPNIAGIIGLGAAVSWLKELGVLAAAAHEAALLTYATKALGAEPDVRIFGSSRQKVPVISFLLGDVHAHDVGTVLDMEGIAVRTGHHCTQPVMDHFGIAATVRASFAVYNTTDEVDRLVNALARVRETFA